MARVLADAVDNGDRLAALKEMARIVAAAIEHPDTQPRDLAALTRRLTDLTSEIESLSASAGDELDELRRRRDGKRAG